MDFTPEQKAAYIAAFIDGEGTVSLRKRKGKNREEHWFRAISFVNTEKKLFDTVVGFCNDLGFEISIYFRDHENPKYLRTYVGHILGGKKAFEIFNRIIPLQHPRKKQDAKGITQSYFTKEEKAQRKHAIHGFESPCNNCGKMFYKTFGQRKQGGGKNCSKKCFTNQQKIKGNATKKCLQCGNSFSRKKSTIGQYKFCSRKCYFTHTNPYKNLLSRRNNLP